MSKSLPLDVNPYRTNTAPKAPTIPLAKGPSMISRIWSSFASWYNQYIDTGILIACVVVFALLFGTGAGVLYLDQRDQISNAATSDAAASWATAHHTSVTWCDSTETMVFCRMADGRVTQYIHHTVRLVAVTQTE